MRRHVSDKVKDRARQAFEKSADQAGSFEHGKNRLVMPGFNAARDQMRDDGKQDEGGGSGGGGNGNGGGGGEGGDVDPIIRGLLVRLPKSGAVWPKGERKLWLQLLEGSFKLIYEDDDSLPPPPRRRDLDV